jgi:hypothetical protein
LTIAGTVDELDAGFLDAIRKPLQVAAGLTTNAEAFEAAVTKGTEKPQEKGKAKSTPATTPAKEKAAEQPKATVKDLVEPTPVETHELPLVEKPAGDELIKQVQACKSHDELTTLVGARGNQERFDTESDLQAAYNAKRSELNAAADAPAAPAKPAPPKPGPPRPGA